jgi:hypothetical protein
MSHDTLENRFERLHDTGYLGYRQRGLLRQMAVISLTLRRGLCQHGIAGNYESHPVQLLSRILFLMRYRCL